MSETANGAPEEIPASDTAAPETASNEANDTSQTEQVEQTKRDPVKALQRRVAEEANKRRRVEAENAELHKKLGTQGTSDSDIDRLVDERIALREQNKLAREIYDQGRAEFKDYDDAVQNVSASLGDKANSRDFLDVVFALPNAAAVLHKLGNDLDAADEIARLSPAKMALKLAQLSGSLQAPKPTIQAAIAPPSPIKPVGSSSTGSYVKDPNKMSIPELDAYMKQKRKEKYGH